jgi:hypothetical protein
MATYSVHDLPGLLTGRLPEAVIEGPALSQVSIADNRSAAAEGEGFVDSISLDEALAIYTQVRTLKPAVTLEIGMFTGASTIAILAALEANGAGEHFACDPFQDTYASNAGVRNVEQAGLAGRLRFKNAFPEDACGSWPNAASFAFIDGSHLFDLTMLDFVLVDKHLAVGGQVGFHDLQMPALRKIVRWAILNRGYEILGTVAVRSRRQRLHSLIAALLRRVPHAEHVWSPELLHPWHEIAPQDRIIFLRKTREDDRDWRAYKPF